MKFLLSAGKRMRMIATKTFLFATILALTSTPFMKAQNVEENFKTDHEILRDHLRVDLLDKEKYPGVDLNGEPSLVAQQVLDSLGTSLQDRLAKLFVKARTPECRAKIATHLGYFLRSIGEEKDMPFSTDRFTSECPEPVYDWDNLPEGMHIGHIQNRTYQPPRDEADYIDNHINLKLLYAILTHDDPDATIRLIEALYDEGHVFVVHVDGKETSDATYARLKVYSSTREHVHLLDEHQRVRINWGGFSMVNATMQILRYAFAIDERSRLPLEFHKFVHIASTSYPLASNTEILHELSKYPLDANLLYIILKPLRPSFGAWHYFVECDDALHRIYRLHPLQNETNGVELYTSSQWFIISREFAQYLAEAKPGTFVHQYLRYVEHVVVADETFFGTVLRHTSYCTKHHNRNLLHLQFDRWESDLPADQRDARKCMMPDPNHCGRSPTTMTTDYADILELSDDLFARKFLDGVDAQVKDIVDDWRKKRELAAKARLLNDENAPRHRELEFEGHGVLVVAKDTLADETPLCLGLGDTGNQLLLVPCFYDWVPPTLAEDWQKGAVILAETRPHNRWKIGPCTTDGHLERLDDATMRVTPGNYSVTGPRCMIKQMDGPRAGRCIDADSGSAQPGGETQVFPCVQRWLQFFSFGDERLAPKGSIFFSIPHHVVRQIQSNGHKQIPYMCLGVFGRGDDDEVDWDDEDDEDEGFQPDENVDYHLENDVEEDEVQSYALSEWINEPIISTQCTNIGAIIEWVFVPFIFEDATSSETEVCQRDSEVDFTTECAISSAPS